MRRFRAGLFLAGSLLFVLAKPASALEYRSTGHAAVLYDAPSTAAGKLTVAGSGLPFEVVVDTEATISPGARVLDDAAPTLIAVADDAAAGHLGPETLLRLPRAADGRGVDLGALLTALYRRGVRSVLLEGGPTLAAAFLAAGAVDKVVGYIAPVLLGAGPAALADAGIPTITRAPRLETADVTRVGPDVRITAYPARLAEES